MIVGPDGAETAASSLTSNSAEALAAELSRAVRGRVRFDTGTRAVYAADASNYRHVPVGVVEPADADDVEAAVAICRAHGTPVLPRGAGTSVAGSAVSTGVVLDFTRSLNRVVAVDPEARTATVQPGLVLDRLQEAAAPYGLRFGPDPATHDRCTLGGMLGNNSCGSHSVAWGKTDDSVVDLDVLTYGGSRLRVGATTDEQWRQRAAQAGPVGAIHAGLRRLREEYGPLLRTGLPRLPRRVSGYALDALLPEHGGDLARALVGTEGGCVTVLEATVRLVDTPAHRALTVIGFPDVYAAAEAALAFVDHQPLTVEGVDGALVDALRAARPAETASRMLPEGTAWLYVSAGGQSTAEAAAAAERTARLARALGGRPVVLTSAAEQRTLWRLREDGAGIATRPARGGEAYPGWEDAAVPPQHLARYLRDLHALQDAHGIHGASYGHFADGCIHTRLNFELRSRKGVAAFRRFMEEAADVAVAHGGSLSGEHGDGQARSELLNRMYAPEAIAAFTLFKDIWDPDGGMNPGAVVRPRRIDEDLRVFLGTPTLPPVTALAFAHDGGDFPSATRRCVGVAKCVTASGGVMCPSYRVTHDEQHSTRGRARLLFEMASGQLVTGGWRSTEVRDALDLCLSCKGCKRDCPVGVDMATYKSEFLAQHYRHRLRPASHYSMGALPRWLRVAGRAPRLANAVSRSRLPAALLKRAAGIAPQRTIPALAPENLRRWLDRRPPAATDPQAPRILLWPDTFTTYFDPQVGQAAVRVLERLGYAVEAPARPVCCALTWLTTGQVGAARRVLRRSLAAVSPWLDADVPIVALEPSCAAMLRSELGQLLPADTAARRLSASVRTFAEVVAGHTDELGRGGEGQAPVGDVLVQPHCHQYADLGTEADRAVLQAAGATPTMLEGCCGLAGNFGFEAGHYDVSMAVAEHTLLPAIRAAAAQTPVLADGFSCRTQIRQAGYRSPRHLAELVDELLGGR